MTEEEEVCEICGQLTVDAFMLKWGGDPPEDAKSVCWCTPTDRAIWKKLKEIEEKIEKMDKCGYWPWPLPGGNEGSGPDSHYTFSAGDTVERNDDQHQSKQE